MLDAAHTVDRVAEVLAMWNLSKAIVAARARREADIGWMYGSHMKNDVTASLLRPSATCRTFPAVLVVDDHHVSLLERGFVDAKDGRQLHRTAGKTARDGALHDPSTSSQLIPMSDATPVMLASLSQWTTTASKTAVNREPGSPQGTWTWRMPSVSQSIRGTAATRMVRNCMGSGCRQRFSRLSYFGAVAPHSGHAAAPVCSRRPHTYNLLKNSSAQ